MHDADGPSARAISAVTSAFQEAQKAQAEFGDSDLISVANRLSAVAVILASAYPHTRFSAPFAALVSFLRRACLLVKSEEVSLPQLMTLTKALRSLADAPLLTLTEAAELEIALEAEGWKGNDAAVQAFVDALLGEEAAQQETLKTMLTFGEAV